MEASFSPHDTHLRFLRKVYSCGVCPRFREYGLGAALPLVSFVLVIALIGWLPPVMHFDWSASSSYTFLLVDLYFFFDGGGRYA